MDGSNSSALHVADAQVEASQYWSASSEYYVEIPGATPARAAPPRRVMISGWHPVEGFEAEVAQEAANRAAHSAR